MLHQNTYLNLKKLINKDFFFKNLFKQSMSRFNNNKKEGKTVKKIIVVVIIKSIGHSSFVTLIFVRNPALDPEFRSNLFSAMFQRFCELFFNKKEEKHSSLFKININIFFIFIFVIYINSLTVHFFVIFSRLVRKYDHII